MYKFLHSHVVMFAARELQYSIRCELVQTSFPIDAPRSLAAVKNGRKFMLQSRFSILSMVHTVWKPYFGYCFRLVYDIKCIAYSQLLAKTDAIDIHSI